MLRYKRLPIALMLTPLLLTGCQPQDNAEVKQEIASLKQEISQLKKEMSTIGGQVKDIHTIAMRSQKPQYKILPTQPNFNEDGKLPSLGDVTAQLAIIEFSDYQCPYCKRFIDQTFTKLKSNYIDTGKIQYLTRDFPLNFHPKAKGAAIAANCSLQQNAYWPMRDTLFKNMQQLDDELYQQTASNLSLDITKFNACLADEQMLNKVQQDVAYGSSLGIRGTPSFVIGRVENGQLISPKLVVGAQNYQTFALLLDELLAPPQ
ncbi:thioredoxin domain-containing protein [Shewanella schlegeliana]|uniref:Thioredoxin domain-containing protein n=1 Tax=Shewanella schlegeliana TaxID=190308 RepID=A0ABS1T2W9_9GAMM|nr:thioredoxin domain-containing protein [Shewanella schlegeliana]MBL4915149.1 thioredoxin domain-containing protein [Shewanella schlegeliana]MCL1110983.1 thioredoxin domain-containing protein [Shewanella schlegeliana]GIU29336.1 thioredoxin [Shewanella schlegeliana]